MAAAIDMLDWVWVEHRTEAGLDRLNFPWWRELTVKQTKSSKRFVPSIDVLAKTIVVLRQTPGLKLVHVKIVEFIVATAQRIDQVCSLERSQIERNPDGSGVIHWSNAQMKGGNFARSRVPSEALSHVASEGRYAFPADERGDRPVRSSVINRWLGNLWGREAQRGPNLTKGSQDRRGEPDRFRPS